MLIARGNAVNRAPQRRSHQCRMIQLSSRWYLNPSCSVLSFWDTLACSGYVFFLSDDTDRARYVLLIVVKDSSLFWVSSASCRATPTEPDMFYWLFDLLLWVPQPVLSSTRFVLWWNRVCWYLKIDSLLDRCFLTDYQAYRYCVTVYSGGRRSVTINTFIRYNASDNSISDRSARPLLQPFDATQTTIQFTSATQLFVLMTCAAQTMYG